MAFPPPVAPARPVSGVIWSPPLIAQGSPAVASNGSMSLIAWGDARFLDVSFNPRFAFATRVDADGRPLDPAGILLTAISSPEAAVWNGERFLVFGRRGNLHLVVSIGTDGSVSEPARLDLAAYERVAAISSSGPNARILFIDGNSNDVLRGHIVDAFGQMVASIDERLAAPLAKPNFNADWVAAGRENDFGIFAAGASVRLGRDGHVRSNTPATWPFSFNAPSMAAAGVDGHGFVILRQSEPYLNGKPTLIACLADDAAAVTATTATIDVPGIVDWGGQYRPAIAPAGDGYVVADTGRFADRSSHEYVSRLSFDLGSTTREVAYAGLPLLLQNGPSRHLLIAQQGPALDLQSVTDEPAAGAPQFFNTTATVQSQPVVAATAGSYAVAWSERGPDAFTRTYVRRFSPRGDPLDAVPLEVDRAPSSSSLVATPPAATLTATADAYIVNGRRLSAATGEWLEPPVSSPYIWSAASNGDGALLAIIDQNGVALQPVGRSGSRPAAVSLAKPVAIPQLASNGSDYLAVWVYSPPCTQTCPAFPTPVYALRVRSDGTAIDAAPIQLSPDGAWVSATSAGGVYVVSWSELDGIHATRISAGGSVLDGPRGVLVDTPQTTPDYLVSHVVAFDGDVILLVRHDPRTDDGVYWTATRMRPDALGAALTAPRTLIPASGSVSATSIDGTLVIAYEDKSDAATGYVPRVYVQHFANSKPRRRTILH